MTQHEKYFPLLWDYIDGELDEKTSAEICAHIKSCDICRSQLEFIKKVKLSMPEALHEPKEGLRDAVMTKIASSKPAKKRLFKPYFGIGTAAALVAVAALFFVAQPKIKEDAADMQNNASGQNESVSLYDGSHNSGIAMDTSDEASNTYFSSTADAEYIVDDKSAPMEKAEVESFNDAAEENIAESPLSGNLSDSAIRGEELFLIKASLDDFKVSNSLDIKKTADIVIAEDIAAAEDIISKENYTYSLFDDYIEIDGEHYGKVVELLTSNSFSIVYSEPYDGAESTVIYSNDH